MLATKIAGCAWSVRSCASLNGSAPTSSLASSTSCGHTACACSAEFGVRLPWPGKRTAVGVIADTQTPLSGSGYGFGAVNPPPGWSGKKAEPLRALHGLRAVAHLELAEEPARVLLHGVRREEERSGDLAVRCAGRHQVEYFALAIGQLEGGPVALWWEDRLPQPDQPHRAHDLRARPVLRDEARCAGGLCGASGDASR